MKDKKIKFISCFQNIGKISFLIHYINSYQFALFKSNAVFVNDAVFSCKLSKFCNSSISKYGQTSLPGLLSGERVHGRWSVTVTAVPSHSFAAPPVCAGPGVLWPHCPLCPLLYIT